MLKTVCLKRVFCVAAITILAVLYEAAIGLPLVSEYYFTSAQKFEKGFLWSNAEELYGKAVAYSPFDARYTAGLADFLLRRRTYGKDKADVYMRAEELYGRACRLDTYSAEYFLTLGQLQLHLFRLDKEIYKDKLAAGIENLQRALDNDPFGVNICYLAGYSSIFVWDYLDEKQKDVFLDKLKYALDHRPWYANYLYPHLWHAAKGPELLRRVTPENPKVRKKLLDFVLKKEAIEGIKAESRKRVEAASDAISPAQWYGKSADGTRAYADGNMYWAGTMGAMLKVPEGNASVIISAKGVPAEGVFPYMDVELDGERIGGVFVDSLEGKDYVFNINTAGAEMVLSIIYTNDRLSKKTGEDMNLYIGQARVRRR
ncbi:MAG TPA: hypothetical protein DCL35_03070 [Candidatus Omnitrophica bacterium]|nr:hypothetical protein [Candidatus Omnitrophota bacterium]